MSKKMILSGLVLTILLNFFMVRVGQISEFTDLMPFLKMYLGGCLAPSCKNSVILNDTPWPAKPVGK